MLDVFRGTRPDITPAQIAAILVAGIPAIGNLLSAFGVYTLSPEEAKALGDTITWCGILAGLLILGDTGVRVGRNVKDGRVESAALFAEGGPRDQAAPPSRADLDDVDDEVADDLRPVQPSEAGLIDPLDPPPPV